MSWLLKQHNLNSNELLPTSKRDADLIDTMAMITSRVITTLIPNFKFAYSDIVTWYCEHEYYEEMSSKSEMVWIS